MKARALALCLMFAPAACDPHGEAVAEHVSWPKGTVLALDGNAIAEEEVDAIASIVARVEPQWSLPHLRRIALTQVVFKRTAARKLAGEQREQALQAANEWRAFAVADAAPDEPAIERLEGGVLQFGLELWDWAIDSTDGEWSPPIESDAAWHVARVAKRTPAERPGAVEIVLEVARFPFVADMRAVETALDAAHLEYVDPSWRELVPTLWQRRLDGGKR